MDFTELIVLFVVGVVLGALTAYQYYEKGYKRGFQDKENLEKQNEYLHATNEQMRQALIKSKVKTEEDFFQINENEVPDDRANGDFKSSSENSG